MKGHHVTGDPPPISSPPSPTSTPQLLSSALLHNLHQSQPSLQISSLSSRPPINTMKRPSSSDSLIPSAFPLDDDGGGADEEMCSAGLGGGEKKRRLGADQVRALEKNFEVENKLDPDRKVRLAQELGLQPRQVAVWFQNRRARWKTKQLERDYSALKSSYDSLRVDFNSLQHENHSLLSQIKELKAKLGEADSCHSVKESTESDAKASEMEAEEPPALIYKEGSPDSDSSAVLNDDAGPYHHHTPAILSNAFPTGSSNHSSTPFSFQQQLLKMEEHGFEDPCSNIFTDDQPPSLPWYYPEQWSWLDVAGASAGAGAGAGETKDGAF